MKGLTKLVVGITLAGSLLAGCSENMLFREKYVKQDLSLEDRKKYASIWDKKTTEEKAAYFKKIPQFCSTLTSGGIEEYVQIWENLSEEERLEHIETLYEDHKEWNYKRVNEKKWDPFTMPRGGWKCGSRKCIGHSHPLHRCR